MEPVQEQIPQQPPLSMYSQPPKPKGSFLRVFFWILFGIVGMVAVGGGAYFMGMKNSTSEPEVVTQVTVTPTSIAVATPTISEQIDTGIPITDKTISFARNGTILYLRYKGKVFTEDKQNSPEEVLGLDEKSLTWYGLVNEPSTIYTKGLNEIFSIKQLPDKKSFLFETRFESQLPDLKIVETITIYQYIPTVSLTKLDEYSTILPVGKMTTYNFPKIDQISSDGKYALFTMFGCWNCGGHTPEHMIMNLDTKQKKSLGKVSFIALGENGAYIYKEYVVTACPTPDPNKEEMIPGECSKDPKDLPLLNGQM